MDNGQLTTENYPFRAWLNRYSVAVIPNLIRNPAAKWSLCRYWIPGQTRNDRGRKCRCTLQEAFTALQFTPATCSWVSRSWKISCNMQQGFPKRESFPQRATRFPETGKPPATCSKVSRLCHSGLDPESSSKVVAMSLPDSGSSPVMTTTLCQFHRARSPIVHCQLSIYLIFTLNDPTRSPFSSSMTSITYQPAGR